MKYILLIKANSFYDLYYNDFNFTILEDFLSSDVGPFSDMYGDFLRSDSKTFGGNACYLEKENNIIGLGYPNYDGENPTIYLRMPIEQFLKILTKWAELWGQNPDFILITQNDQKEINLEGFDTEQEVRNKMRSFGLTYPKVDN